jgi:hypothetical protein
MSDLYIPTIDQPFLLPENMWTDLGNIYVAHTHRHMNAEIWTEAEQFPEKEYINGIFVAVHRHSYPFPPYLVYSVSTYAWINVLNDAIWTYAKLQSTEVYFLPNQQNVEIAQYAVFS